MIKLKVVDDNSRKTGFKCPWAVKVCCGLFFPDRINYVQLDTQVSEQMPNISEKFLLKTKAYDFVVNPFWSIQQINVGLMK